jgi:hypothetical protein
MCGESITLTLLLQAETSVMIYKTRLIGGVLTYRLIIPLRIMNLPELYNILISVTTWKQNKHHLNIFSSHVWSH